jgi:signal transduction histidine kinase
VNARAAAGLAWSLCLLTLAVLVVGLVLWVANGFPVLLGSDPATGGAPIRLLAVLTFALIAIVGLLIATRQPSNPIGWIILAADLVSSFDLFGQNFAAYALSDWPTAARLVAALAYPLNVSAALISAMLVLFPNGRLPSARWRWVLWLAGGSGVLQVLHRALRPGPLRMAPSEQNPFGMPSAAPVLAAIEVAAQLGLAAALLLAAASLVLRWRHARGDERLQLRWIAYAVLPWAAVFATSVVVPQAWQPVVRVVYFLVLDLFVIALGVAVLKYRLYDIDLVVNRALVYGALGAFITAVYVTVVFGISAAVDATTELDVWLSLLATVIVALAFQPVREQAQRLANRLVYGRRASPYEVLADFSRRLVGALAADEVLPRMAEAAAQGVGAARARVRVYVPGGADRAVAWPSETVDAAFERTLAVLHQGTLVGEIAVSKPPGESFTPAEQRLLADLAAQAGAALNGVRLSVELQARLEQISAQASELRASRQRIVSAQDAERRRLERDLHDGAQQYLVSLSVNARLARELVRAEPGEAENLLDDVGAQASEALVALRTLARGIFPPALADRGLLAALQAHVASIRPPVHMDSDGLGLDQRFLPEVETAVYFCCLEALQNCAKHAPGAAVHVALTRPDANWLTFSIRDEGPGFDPASVPAGSGHQHMADRLAALDGTLHVSSAPGRGTTVSGRLPIDHRAEATPRAATPLAGAPPRWDTRGSTR